LDAFEKENVDLALSVVSLKKEVEELTAEIETHLTERLIGKNSTKFANYSFELDITNKLNRLYFHTKRIAQTVINLPNSQ
ncbi:MAG: hypothetical protein GY786_11195, partial [Proteobacteria bacterium]|nr:hypothetical protein [Pseudomonadota bacterium]